MFKVKTKNQTSIQVQVLENLLEEMRLLRQDISILFPQDDLDNYENSQRIKDSYKKALEQYGDN